MDVTITDGTQYMPRIPYAKYARLKSWRAIQVGYGRSTLYDYEGRGAPTKWKIGLKFFSLGLYKYQADCVGTTIEVLEAAGLDPFSRMITSPRKLMRELERRGHR